MSVGRGEKNLENYSEEDQKLLISLLNEYTEKLSTICEKLDKYLGEQGFNWFNSLLPFTGLIAFGRLIWLNHFFPDSSLSRFFNSSSFSQPSIVAQYLVPLSVCLMVLSLYFLALNLVKVSRVSLQIKKSFHDAKMLAKRLKKVTQIVSQIEEHSVRRFSGRIEMDLRLADTEIVLEYYRVRSHRYKWAGIMPEFLAYFMEVEN
jgi:hypothetical protein